MTESWEESQKLESSFWRTCVNTYGEETKQFLYMSRMGFKTSHDGRSPFSYDGHGLSYLDIGGGPVSILLKFRNASRRIVVDPCHYPKWVYDRYKEEGIECMTCPGETAGLPSVNVAFIYNVLQHVSDPRMVVENALRSSKELCMFEWIDLPPHPGHPHCLTQANLESWTGLKGKVEQFNGTNECYGHAWYV